MNFKEAKKLKIACIYRLSYPDGKCYIGRTKDLSYRIELYENQLSGDLKKNSLNLSALRSFGFDRVDVSILQELDIRDESNLLLCLSILEIKYIRELDTLYPNGYNISPGGEVLGIPDKFINTKLNRVCNSKRVLLYDQNGRFVREYPSKSKCCYDLGISDTSLSSYLDRPKIYRDKYIFKLSKYDYVPPFIEVSGYKVLNRVKTIVKRKVINEVIKREYVCHVVPHALKYDCSGKFCGEFESKIKALSTYSKSHSVPYGKYHNGYILYKKVSDDYPKQIEPYEETLNKILGESYKPLSECETMPEPVLTPTYFTKNDGYKNDITVAQYDLKGILIAQYPGIRHASASTGIRYSCIWQCVRGVTKKAGGYVWKKVEDES